MVSRQLTGVKKARRAIRFRLDGARMKTSNDQFTAGDGERNPGLGGASFHEIICSNSW